MLLFVSMIYITHITHKYANKALGYESINSITKLKRKTKIKRIKEKENSYETNEFDSFRFLCRRCFSKLHVIYK